MIYALWHGGPNYGPGEVSHETETFPSIAAAKDALEDRYTSNGHRQVDFTYADGRLKRHYTPCVTLEAEMFLYFADPRQDRDPYPDRILSFGPRGGIRSERA